MNDLEFEYSAANPAAPVAFASFGAMHTIVEIVIVGMGEEQAKSAMQSCRTLIETLDDMLNRHNPQSTIAQINKTNKTEVDEQTYMVLELCEAMRRATLGYFDIAAMSDSNNNPKFILNPQNHTIELCSDKTLLDLGGFAKGYALERIKAELTQMGAKSALINFGNSSVAGIGKHPFGDAWQVGTQVNDLCNFTLADSSLSVSGKAPRAKAHIVDPISTKLCQSDEIVAVEGTSALICEILSTALYAAPRQKRAEIIAEFDGYRATAIDFDGNRVEIKI